jgi:hypothetical protein
MRVTLQMAFGLALLVSFGCGTPHHHHRGQVVREPGPPPWAPAHGYRHKHAQGMELVYDAQLGVYVVVGRDGLHFRHDRFYRWHAETWRVSWRADGPWRTTESHRLPPGLRKQHAKKHGKKKHHAKRLPPGQAKKLSYPANAR